MLDYLDAMANYSHKRLWRPRSKRSTGLDPIDEAHGHNVSYSARSYYLKFWLGNFGFQKCYLKFLIRDILGT
jgi:hypothetical protein